MERTDGTAETGMMQPPNEQQAKATTVVAIAGSFTVDPLLGPLRFWVRTLGIAADVIASPYGQVLQALLKPDSELAANTSGFNVLALRVEDWIRDRQPMGADEGVEHVARVAREITSAVEVLQARTSAPLLVVLCPLSSDLSDRYRLAFTQVESGLIANLASLPRVQCWRYQDFASLYRVAEIEDVRADRLAHIPYTTEFYTAVATFLARRIAAVLKPRHKVIAVDCDNTLWQGVCGEDGAEGVRITSAHRRLQQMLVRQHEAGMLVCLCTKNNPGDVEAVFRAHPDMPLREEHIVSSRVNWAPKSANLQDLAKELGLALDSFIFIDDSALECDEVRTHCPPVLTLQLPQTDDEVTRFLDHVWAFDKAGVTQEAKRRTAQYRENRARSEALERAASYEQFLASLDLRVEMQPLHQRQLPRVAELVQRTTQFNFTGLRRTQSQIEELWNSNQLQVDTISVADRFGDYGLVGVVFTKQTPVAIEVDTLVLSCRALGRAVEHRMVGELGRRAREAGLSNVLFKLRLTARNVPARLFLERSFAEFETAKSDSPDHERLFIVPAAYCEQLPSLRPAEASAAAIADDPAPTSVIQSSGSHDWHAAAYRLSRVTDIVREMNRLSGPRAAPAPDHVSPRTSMETAVASIWTDVLGIAEMGVNADFLQLGGDSLAAVRVISRIGDVLGLELSLSEFFEQPTIAALAAKLESNAKVATRIQPANRDGLLPLSWAQQRLWFIELLEQGAAAYHIAWGGRLSGAVNRKALQSALDEILQRHEALRMVFINQDGTPTQQLTDAAHFALEVDAFGGDSEQMTALIETEVMKRFDLQHGPLIRGKLLELAADEHLLLLTVHHIVADGWSVRVLLRELSAAYIRHVGDGAASLPPLTIQYGDYAQWQQHRLSDGGLEQQLKYWQQQLQGAPPLLRLPTDRPRPLVQSYRGAAVNSVISTELVESLKALARRANVTLPMVIHAAWSIVLGRLSGQDDVVVGIPVANRRHAQLEPLIGLFANTLAIRARLHDELTTEDLLRQLRTSMFGAYANQDAPFEKVVEMLHPARSSSYSPLVQVMLAFQNAPAGELRLPGITVTEQDLPVRAAQFDLVLSLADSHSGIVATLIFASDLFDETTIHRWLGYFVAALGVMATDPQCSIGKLRLMGDDERHRIVQEFNRSQIDFPKHQLAHEVIAAHARRRAQAPALLYDGHSLTYGELDARARLLAEKLVSLGVGPDQCVAVCLDRGIDLAVSVLAIFKAGGVFVPLDPAYPPERLAYMLEDAAPRVLLVHPEFVDILPKTSATIVSLEWGWPDALRAEGHAGLSQPIAQTGHSVAYIIYTSGSTGKPKGVMVEHGGLLNLAYAQQAALGVGENSRVLQFASPSFDAFMWEYVMALCAGACLCLAPRDELTPGEPLFRTLKTFGVTHVTLPPVALQALPGSEGLQLATIVVAGEACPVGLAHQWGPGRRFVNAYGPTEATVCGTMYEWKPEAGDTVPIGRPIANATIYILDKNGEPVPLGVAGEIHIGGAGVARGYLHRPELTENRFIADHFAADSRARLYKTGDLGRWRADGMVEFLGRNDDQVKIRGFRVELGEIEAQLANHPAVKDAVVIARENNGEKQLIAYVTKRDTTTTPAVDELRSHLRAALPDHMIPSAFVVMDAFRVTPSGKIDRRVLPAPDINAFVRHEYQAPENATEQTLIEIWRELLPIEQIGRQDNFFELGGHSLLAVKALARINDACNCSLQVTDLYRYPSVAELARRISDATAEDSVVDLESEARLDADIRPRAGDRRVPERHVLLTGATGFVGRFLLEKLLTSTTATIHCVVRSEQPAEALSRLKASMIKWDLWRDEFAHRVIAVPGDLRRPMLGLDETSYANLCNSIDTIYHSATSMNHLEPYAMARAANVEGAKEVVRLAARGCPKLINYLSTLGVFAVAPPGPSRVVHEDTPIDAEGHRASEGYLASKWVSEKVFMMAHDRGTACNIFRLGLIWADSRLGRYDELQHGYRMLKSCLLTGIGVEGYRFGMNPTPVDYAVDAVVALANEHPNGGGVFHIASARQSEEGLFERCNRVAGASLRLKSEYQWIREMKRRYREGRSIPAVPLIQFAFDMDQETFDRHVSQARRRTTEISCERTYEELEALGIVAPYLDDDLLRLSIKSMLTRDADLRAMRRGAAPWLASIDQKGVADDLCAPMSQRQREHVQELRS